MPIIDHRTAPNVTLQMTDISTNDATRSVAMYNRSINANLMIGPSEMKKSALEAALTDVKNEDLLCAKSDCSPAKLPPVAAPPPSLLLTAQLLFYV